MARPSCLIYGDNILQKGGDLTAIDIVGVVIRTVVLRTAGLTLSGSTGGVIAVVAELAAVGSASGVDAGDGVIRLAVGDWLVGRIIEANKVASEPGPGVGEVYGEINTKCWGSKEDGGVVLGCFGILHNWEKVACVSWL